MGVHDRRGPLYPDPHCLTWPHDLVPLVSVLLTRQRIGAQRHWSNLAADAPDPPPPARVSLPVDSTFPTHIAQLILTITFLSSPWCSGTPVSKPRTPARTSPSTTIPEPPLLTTDQPTSATPTRFRAPRGSAWAPLSFPPPSHAAEVEPRRNSTGEPRSVRSRRAEDRFVREKHDSKVQNIKRHELYSIQTSELWKCVEISRKIVKMQTQMFSNLITQLQFLHTF